MNIGGRGAGRRYFWLNIVELRLTDAWVSSSLAHPIAVACMSGNTLALRLRPDRGPFRAAARNSSARLCPRSACSRARAAICSVTSRRGTILRSRNGGRGGRWFGRRCRLFPHIHEQVDRRALDDLSSDIGIWAAIEAIALFDRRVDRPRRPQRRAALRLRAPRLRSRTGLDEVGHDLRRRAGRRPR